MAVLCDTQDRELVGIEPFENGDKRTGGVSCGLSGHGYHIRVGTRFNVFTNVNPLEPKWRGTVTPVISDTSPLPTRIHANEGIARIVFIKADRVCVMSHADMGGKDRDQAELTLPRVD